MNIFLKNHSAYEAQVIAQLLGVPTKNITKVTKRPRPTHKWIKLNPNK